MTAHKLLHIYPDSIYYKNHFIGGKLNQNLHKHKYRFDQALQPLGLIRDSLYNADQYYAPEYLGLKDDIKRAKNKELKDSLIAKRNLLRESKEMYLPFARRVEIQNDSIWKSLKEWQEDYINNNDDILAYSWLYQKFEYMEELDPVAVKNFNRMAEKHPEHPYTDIINEKINVLNTIKLGGSYVDCTALNADGDSVKISDFVKGKLAFINLWATWCGPCRAKGISMIPVYEKYKDKGFTVLGIAGVHKMEHYHKAIKKDNYPWPNLIEFNNQNKIWFKYNVEGSGGDSFLIDATGKILAISPKADEVEEILNKVLN